MSRKNRPNTKPLVQPAPPPVLHGNVFATFMREASEIGQEVEARRAFDKDVGAYLASKGLVEEFEAFREAQREPKV